MICISEVRDKNIYFFLQPKKKLSEDLWTSERLSIKNISKWQNIEMYYLKFFFLFGTLSQGHFAEIYFI